MGNSNNNGIVIFVLGLLGIITCQLLAPIAWMMGNSYVAQCEAMGVTPDGMGVAGRIMGMIGTALLVLQFVLFGGIMLLYCVGIFFAVVLGG